jgi:hypothetical protein
MADINKPQDNLRANADAAIRKSADAMQQGGHATADALRQNAEAGADVARRGTEAGPTRCAAPATCERHGAPGRAGGGGEPAPDRQDAAQRFEEVSRKVADATRARPRTCAS